MNKKMWKHCQNLSITEISRLLNEGHLLNIINFNYAYRKRMAKIYLRILGIANAYYKSTYYGTHNTDP